VKGLIDAQTYRSISRYFDSTSQLTELLAQLPSLTDTDFNLWYNTNSALTEQTLWNFKTYFQGILIVTPTQKIVFDTGNGIVAPATIEGRILSLYDQLVELGCEDIDMIVHSHLHGDHTGWDVTYDTNNDIVPTWPLPTTYVVQSDEYNYWASTLQTQSQINWAQRIKPVVDAQQIQLLDGTIGLMTT